MRTQKEIQNRIELLNYYITINKKHPDVIIGVAAQRDILNWVLS